MPQMSAVARNQMWHLLQVSLIYIYILCSLRFTIDCNCFQVALSSTPTTKLVHKIRGDKKHRVIKIMQSLLYRILRSAVVNKRSSVTAASEMSRLYWSRSSMLYALLKAELEARLSALPGWNSRPRSQWLLPARVWVNWLPGVSFA